MTLISEFVSSCFRAYKAGSKVVGKTYTTQDPEGEGQLRLTASGGKSCLRRCAFCLGLAALKGIQAVMMMGGGSGRNVIGFGGNLMIASFMLTCAVTYWERGRRPELIGQFFKGLLELEARAQKGIFVTSSSLKTRIAKRFSQYTTLLVYPLPTLLAIRCVLQPRQPLNFVLIHPSTDNKPVWKIVISGTYYIANQLIYLMLVGVGNRLVLETVAGPICLDFGQQIVFRTLLNLRKFGTSRESRGIVLQRSLQLIAELYNSAQSSILVVFLMTSGLSQVISMGALVNSSSSSTKWEMSLPLRLFFGVVAFETVIVINVVYGYAGDLNQDSIRMQEMLRRKQMWNKNKRAYFQRFLHSCPPLKVSFGSCNYIDKTTPLVFQSFCILRLIDLLLLKTR